jgi:Protein of unknown function (DUF5132)
MIFAAATGREVHEVALLEDLFKGNLLTGVAVGLGAILLAPAAGQVLRPAAKVVIKGGMLAYQALAELGEVASDLVAEAGAELAHDRITEAGTPRASPATRPKS